MQQTPSSIIRSTVRALAIGLPLAGTAAQVVAQAQPSSFPSRPLRVVVAFPPGATTDTIARLLQPRQAEAFGQTVLIDPSPRPGGTCQGASFSGI